MRNKIIYWIATIWLALGMTTTGFIQLLEVDEQTIVINRLGFPLYILKLIGTLKLLGVLAILLPKKPILKEWAYAGFTFTMVGAIFSHIAVNDAPIELFGPVLLLILTATSWFFRPASRGVMSSQK